jgi:ATP-dependent Clp protease ATP-binding subunit ClpC
MIMRQTTAGFNLKMDEQLEEKLAYQEMRKKLTDSLRRVFRPEFINRVDSVIVFRSLSKEDIHNIVALELEKVAERLEEHDITLKPTDEAIDVLAELGYEREYGARPLKRVIQQKVEDNLSDALLSGEFEDGDVVVIDVEEGEDEQPEIILRHGEAEGEETPEALPTG